MRFNKQHCIHLLKQSCNSKDPYIRIKHQNPYMDAVPLLLLAMRMESLFISCSQGPIVNSPNVRLGMAHPDRPTLPGLLRFLSEVYNYDASYCETFSFS